MSVAPDQFPSPKKFARRLCRRLLSLLERQPGLVRACRQQGEPEQIHELRTFTRRLRVMLGLAAPCLGKKRTRLALRRTRQTSRITSRLRDLDVTLAFLARHPELTRAIPILQQRRRRLWLRHRRELPATTSDMPGFRRIDRLHRDNAKLARRYARKLERHRAAVLAVSVDFNALPLAQQHVLRRTIRRLRYLRELGLARHRLSADPVCQALVRAQDAIGFRRDQTVCHAELLTLRHSSAARPSLVLLRPQRRIAPPFKKLQSILARWKPSFRSTRRG